MLVTPLSPADSPGPPSALTEDTLICPGHGIIIHHDDAAADARQICRAVDIAIKFMATHRFDTGVGVTIRIVEAPVKLHDIEAIATYDAATSIITVPSFDYCCRTVAGPPAFGTEVTRELWRSFVVHELAHAVAHVNFRMAEAPRVSHEYIAYVVQIATMPPPLISEILENYPNRAFASERAINQHILDLDPQVFAVKAYRHFLALDDGAAFFDRILTGDFRRFERD